MRKLGRAVLERAGDMPARGARLVARVLARRLGVGAGGERAALGEAASGRPTVAVEGAQLALAAFRAAPACTAGRASRPHRSASIASSSACSGSASASVWSASACVAASLACKASRRLRGEGNGRGAGGERRRLRVLTGWDQNMRNQGLIKRLTEPPFLALTRACPAARPASPPPSAACSPACLQDECVCCTQTPTRERGGSAARWSTFWDIHCMPNRISASPRACNGRPPKHSLKAREASCTVFGSAAAQAPANVPSASRQRPSMSSRMACGWIGVVGGVEGRSRGAPEDGRAPAAAAARLAALPLRSSSARPPSRPGSAPGPLRCRAAS